MIRKLAVVLICLFFAKSASLVAQGFASPSEGNAVVYFVRVTGYGGATSFEYFHQDKFIGIFKGKNYLRYECPAGENLLWASSENKEFITADLQAGGTYLILVDVIIGAWKAHVGLSPLTPDREKAFQRAIDLIKSKGPVQTPQAKIDKTNKKLETFIDEKLKLYETEWKGVRNFKHISPEMALSEEVMR